jgi:hypothetical protein
MPPSPAPAPPARRGFFDQFKGLQWWEIVLVVIPLGLVILGGLIGAVIGILGLIANLQIARRVPSPGLRALAMVGVIIACYVVIFIVAALLYAATHPTT